MVPWLWFMSRTADCRMFQEKTVPDILKQLFTGDTKFELTGTYRKWEYCVQYRETDFNFVSRLMEEEGIYYYFTHENGKHTLIVTDAASNHKAAPDYAELLYGDNDPESGHDAFIWDWTINQGIRPTEHAITDFDPLQPKNNLFKSHKVEHSHDPIPYEIFDYPGGYVTGDEGRVYARVRMEESESQYIVGHGQSNARGIFAGAIFKLQEHPVCEAEDYLIISATYMLQNDDLGIGYKSEGELFTCQVTAIPNKHEFRSPRVTPKPFVQGPQTAIIVGKSGEEIWTDKHGRVKVKFHWDRQSKADENSSCWIRVSQNWAGKKWGIFFLPRIGQEVIVDFLEGDPDRPIITGRVYNGENTPPYDLPTMQTISTIKSNSSKGGEGFNEFRFEDKKGEEQIFIHAQKNMDIRVKNDRFETIGTDKVGNRHLVVEKDKFEHIKNDRNELIGNDHKEEIVKDRHVKIGGKEAIEIAETQSLKVGDDVTEVFAKNHSEDTTNDYYLRADNIVIEGKTSITIKVGSNYIAIDKQGIKIGCEEPMATFETSSTGDTTVKASMNAKFESGMNLDVKAGMMGTYKAGMTLAIDGGMMAELKGMLVKIN
jgi:type VI secretion system secreted protein VgrG